MCCCNHKAYPVHDHSPYSSTPLCHFLKAAMCTAKSAKLMDLNWIRHAFVNMKVYWMCREDDPSVKKGTFNTPFHHLFTHGWYTFTAQIYPYVSTEADFHIPAAERRVIELPLLEVAFRSAWVWSKWAGSLFLKRVVFCRAMQRCTSPTRRAALCPAALPVSSAPSPKCCYLINQINKTIN